MTIDQLLQFAVEQDASDLHLQAGSPPQLRLKGRMREVDSPALTDEQIRGFIKAIGPRKVVEDVNAAMAEGFDFSYSAASLGRFRCNLYSHLGTPAMVLRVISPKIRGLDDLHIPNVVKEIAQSRRGLMLMSGATGSGKTTTLAAIVELLNANYHLKILTIEDPVEYEHDSKKSLVAHVEVGRDTPSYEHALRQAMRQAPDVILIGELRDTTSVQMALRAADTGHQVFATIHASNAAQTVERLLAMIPIDELAIAKEQLAASLSGVVSQRLALSKQNTRWPVVEVLRGDSVVSKYILENRIHEIADYVASGQHGMQTFDMHLLDLFHEGVLSGTEALRVATNPEALALNMRMPGQLRPA